MPARRARPSGDTPEAGESPPDRAPAQPSGASVPQKFPIVAIGASAGGLEACQKLFDGVTADAHMAFIVVQHLDPHHDSMLAVLLSTHTALPVRQAADGVLIEKGHVYVIPPGAYLAVKHGRLAVSKPEARHGARLPFDFLLAALAREPGTRTIAVFLSGTGDDGSRSLEAVRAAGGYVIAQHPDEAGYDGMPRSAIQTGGVDLILPLAEIPKALDAAAKGRPGGVSQGRPRGRGDPDGVLGDIIERVRSRTGHDFTLYKPGTLHRRIQRRMALASIPSDQIEQYRDRLVSDGAELERLGKDLLIHVTRFFRDPKAFDALFRTIIPELMRNRQASDPLRVWVAGCSTGEEAYSIAIVFREAIAASGGDFKLQVFASDIDLDAVATAREGLYPDSIAGQVSPERLERFFTREDRNYRISNELRSMVVFTPQNVLADPPFSKLDLISCRNLLIYLRPEAQAKVIGVFHFALKPGGVLLLGGSETAAHAEGRFAPLIRPVRLYRQIGRARAPELNFFSPMSGPPRRGAAPGAAATAASSSSLADLARRLVLETHAPAAILINRARECLFALGPVDRYLKVAGGPPSHDVLAMARSDVRAKLANAIAQVLDQDRAVSIKGGALRRDGAVTRFELQASPVVHAGESLILVCFVEQPPESAGPGSQDAASQSRVTELETELEATRAELHGAMRALDIATEETSTINEEALSVNEEYQSTNEELLTSKEELQSLNEELNALNSQLQETLDRQRTTATDLQNILYSTDVATVFLDRELRIRFFTPATRALFSVLPTDIGRPLADLRALAPDADLLADAARMLQRDGPAAREIEAVGGTWYLRRILPYRAQGDAIEGVVITYSDITDRKETAKRLEAATLAADSANRAKSRFLAAASHDLRQPLQTLTLIQGLLTRDALSASARKLIDLQEQCLTAMSGMLNTILDINQIDAGIVRAEVVDFRLDTLFDRLRDEFADHAQAKGLRLRVVRCRLTVRSDPVLLEQLLRNLVANAMKFTPSGKILLGARRRGDRLSIQVVDTGVGIRASDHESIFEEYHQVEDAIQEPSRGLGLGLSIVRRLGVLLGHPVKLRSKPGRGSSFTVEVDLSGSAALSAAPASKEAPVLPPRVTEPLRRGEILVVEDDAETRSLLKQVLSREGHRAIDAGDGHQALDLLAGGKVEPDVILVDYNLPGEMNGLDLAVAIRTRLLAATPVVVLTGDISTGTLRAIAERNCVPMHKPVRPDVLTRVIQALLPSSAPSAPPSLEEGAPPTIFIVDDDGGIRDALRHLVEAEGMNALAFADSESFLAAYRPGAVGCLLIDAYMPGGMSGLDLLKTLRARGATLPSIMITGGADIEIAVEAMKAGAVDFIEKPIKGAELMAHIALALERSKDVTAATSAKAAAATRITRLTARQRDILDRVLTGQASKNIAADLGISQRTVENHRAAIMRRTGAKSLPALARLALAAAAVEAG